MLQVIGDLLPPALGIAISPVAIIFLILMLISERAKVTAPAFVLGWLIGVAAVTAAALALADGADASTDDTTANGVYAMQLAFGVVFLLLAIKTWRSRPDNADASSADEPKLFQMVDTLSAPKAIGIGVALATVVAPKNLIFEVGAGAATAKAGLSIGGDIGVAVVFVAVASVAVIAPTIAVFLLGTRADAALARVKEWLITNNNTIMLVLFVVLGARFVGKGLRLFS